MSEVRIVSLGVFVTSVVLGAVGIATGICFLVINQVYRSRRLIKMSSPNLNVLICSGGFLLNIACMLLASDHFLARNITTSTTTVCQIRLWIIICAFTLVFGPVMAKSWRVNKIFQTAASKKVVIPDEKLFLMVTVCVIIDVLFLSFWQGLDPLKPSVTHFLEQDSSPVPSNRSELPLVSVYACSSRNSSLWLTMMTVWKSVLVSGVLYFSWKIRNVILPSMNDARTNIGSALSSIIVMSITTIAVTAFSKNPDGAYSCLILGIWICNLLTQCILFVPKIYLLIKTPENSNFRLSMSAKAFNRTMRPMEQLEEEMFHIVTENKTLKKSLSEKEEEIQDLQNHLDDAKEKLMQMTEELNDQEGSDEESGSDYNEYSRHNQNVTAETDIEMDMGGNRKGRDTSDRSDYSRGSSQTREKYLERQSSSKSIRSSHSTGSWHKLQRLRNSIAENITHAHHISSAIKDTISHELHRQRPYKTPAYDSISRRQDLTGAIAKSYDVSDNADTYSYVSNYLPITQTVYGIGYECNNGQLLPFGEITDSSQGIPNDRLYPESIQWNTNILPTKPKLESFVNKRTHLQKTQESHIHTDHEPIIKNGGSNIPKRYRKSSRNEDATIPEVQPSHSPGINKVSLAHIQQLKSYTHSIV